MGMTFSHLLAGFAATANVVTPSSSADPGSIRNAIVLLLGLILSCVSVAIFQRSINKKGKQSPKQGHATESQMFQTLEHAIEEGRASLDLDVTASPNAHEDEEIPSPLAQLAPQFEKALPVPKPDPKPDPIIDPKTEHGQFPQSALNGANGSNGINGNGSAHQPPNPAREANARVSLPRLSELRGMRFSQALRELDKAKRSSPPNAGLSSINGSPNSSINDALNDALADGYNDTPDGSLNDPIDDPISEALMSAIAPFEAMFASSASAPPSNNKGRRREDSGRSPREPKAPEKETNGYIDQLQVLPSRRGQYKKKG
jgi:hypothetical protein